MEFSCQADYVWKLHGDVAGNSFIEPYNGPDEQDGTNDAVENPERPDIEMGTGFVDEICYQPPPEQCSGKNGHVAEDVVIVAELGQKEIEPCEQSDDKEEDEWIRHGE